MDHITMVTLDWVLDSLKKKKRLDIAPYKLDSSSTSSPPSTASGSTNSSDSKKRKASDPADEDEKVDKKIKVLKEIRQPPVDMACTLPSTYSVYTDSDVAWNARLNQTNLDPNNNKFYMIQLLATPTNQYAVFCHWGRVGANGQKSTDMFPDLDLAKRCFEGKFREKTKNAWADRDNFEKRPGKYYLLPPDDGDSDEEVEEDKSKSKNKGKDKGKGKKIEGSKESKDDQTTPKSKLHHKVQELVELIFNTGMMNRQMKELDYDADKMPLGKLAKSTILHGYEVLKRISEVLGGKPNMPLLSDLSSEFYTVIPHNFGRNVPPVIRDAPTLKKKLEMLEALGEIEIAQKLIKENKKLDEALTINPLDQQFASLKLNKLEPMSKTSERYKLIEKYVKNTHGTTHSMYDLVIDEVFDLERQGETERFADAGFSKFHNRRLLWHGSRLTNYVGILSQGLRIAPPEAPATGYMFDKGAYFADCVSKSANYCFTNGSDNVGLMLLCEVALGDMHELEQSDYNAKANSQKAGKHSTKGCGLSYPDEAHDVNIDDGLRVQAGPLKSGSRGAGFRLQYNEYIVYDVSQVKMRYLLKMKFSY
ncbi:Poly [ADP-ribose] polymerase 2 [Modicella reniformis]|uniref:Poly [ADP-ribose] polymerase n=1 Tax=Modicella reniformis TaxID=1440133 RepID=A0A9P6J6R8_9FUNG|nr:Poly [ADP-ribose] polymerase 2 [Modicella reniformis]